MKKETILAEPTLPFIRQASEETRLKEDVFRSDMEKFRLFTKMLRTDAMLKKANVTHK